MKCPVCDTELKNTTDKNVRCFRCGFDDIRTEFLNNEEIAFWQNYVVKPCKYAYHLNKALQSEVDMLHREIKKMSSVKATDSKVSGSGAPQQAKVTILDGWNYDDPIAHPNSAEGKYYNIRFCVTDINIQMKSTSNVTVTFLVKKLSDDEGKNSAKMFCIRYRVKDQDGIILLNKDMAISGLCVGDVSRESIELTGVVTGSYTIDFVSYN